MRSLLGTESLETLLYSLHLSSGSLRSVMARYWCQSCQYTLMILDQYKSRLESLLRQYRNDNTGPTLRDNFSPILSISIGTTLFVSAGPDLVVNVGTSPTSVISQ
ncbi:hypothetical protein PUN28_012763 [Cardiocondyla obscurior]|uniref:Uncharacterized protein n=1 Tax=Cardiocondyla obscurior TaxID=286306 RepID=A0AAW2F606_9HYME